MIFTIFGGGKAKHYEQRKKRSDFGGHRDHATLGLGLRLGLGGPWRTHDIPLAYIGFVGPSIPRETAYVLPGVCLTVTILRDQRPRRRYALYCVPF